MAIRFKDPVSGGTHLVGALLAAAGAVMLNILAFRYGTVWHIFSFSVFGASLILLYTTSSLYHLLPMSPANTRIMRKVDHIMIFVLIAGSGTPLCLITLGGALGWFYFFLLWGFALAGTLLKLYWLDAPRWLSTALYVGMGYSLIFAIYPLVQKMSLAGFKWVALAGLFYTMGAAVYALKRPDPFPRWLGFHEIFHLFVLAGSGSHFWAVIKYVR